MHRTTPHATQHNSLRIFAATAMAAVVLASAPAARARDDTTPLQVGASFDPSAAVERGFTVGDAKALKGIRRVAVPVFAVEFITADNVTSQTSGFASAGRASSSLFYTLLGVGEADFQAITDALYAQFLADLQASGVQVLGADAFKGLPSYTKLVATGAPGSVKGDASMQISPAGLGLYGFARMGGGNSAKGKSVFGAISDMGAGFSAVGAIGDTIALAKELDASLLEVRMRVSFVQLSNDSAGFLGRLSGTAATSGKVFPSVDNVMLQVQSGDWRSVLTMKHTLTLDGAAFAEVREKTATTGEKVGAVAGELLKLAFGNRDTSSSSQLEVVADPEKYRGVIASGLGSATSMLVARMKAER